MIFQWFLLYILMLIAAFLFTCNWFGSLCERGKWAAFWFWAVNFIFIAYMCLGGQ